MHVLAELNHAGCDRVHEIYPKLLGIFCDCIAPASGKADGCIHYNAAGSVLEHSAQEVLRSWGTLDAELPTNQAERSPVSPTQGYFLGPNSPIEGYKPATRWLMQRGGTPSLNNLPFHKEMRNYGAGPLRYLYGANSGGSKPTRFIGANSEKSRTRLSGTTFSIPPLLILAFV